jgi:hypothetical protein
MKRKILHRYLFAIGFLSIITFSAKSQVIWDTLPYKTYADYKLQNLDKSNITSGILYDRIFPVADIERFKQQDQFTDTTGPRHCIQAYYELYHSAYDNSSWLSPDALEANLNTNTYVNAIPIGVLNYKYNVMDTNAYVDNLVDTLPNGQFVDVAGRPRSPYFNYSTFIASPIIADDAVFVEDQEYTFYLDPQFFLYNDYIDVKQIRIDFGDGQGEWVVDNPYGGGSMQRTTSVFSSITKRIGRTIIGRIVVIGIDVAGHWIRYGNPFKILAKKKKDEYPLTPCKGGKGGGTKWVIDPDPAKLAPINAQYGNPPAVHNQIVRTGPGLFDFIVEPVKDTAYFFFKDDGNNCAGKVVRRPVIFIDGIDPTNDRKVGDIYKEYINKSVIRNGTQVLFGDYMLDNGNADPNDDLDFIILDFKHGNDLLERNAMALVALIERLNQTYGSNYLQDITLIGPSMGSLIAQYALSYMENNNIPHRVRTYISFDGCHQGANVPIGLQNYIEYITRRGILKGVKSIREGLYNGLAAKQMLAHHHTANSQFPAPDALRNQFLQNLAAVGEYPQQSRKVALINGAGNGTLNPNHGTNTELLDIEIKRKGWKSIWGLCNDNICKKIKWIGRTATNNGTNRVAEMWTASPLYNVLFWVPLGKKNYYADAAWGNSSQDNAPGGLIGDRFSDDMETHGTFLAKELIYLLTGDKPTFNININNFTMMPSYSAADIRYPNKNLYQRIDQCPPTPFDHIYAPTYNQEHVSVSPEGSVWFENEARGILPCNTSCTVMSGPSAFCNDAVFSVNVSPGTNVTWSASPQIVTFNPVSGNQTTATKNIDGTTTITATISGCSTPITKEILVGAPLPPTIVGLNYDRWCGTYVEAGCTHPAGATNYIWNLNYGQVTGEGDYFYQAPLVYNPMVGFTYYNYLSVQAQNACGLSDPTTVSLTVGPVPARCGGGMQLLLAPNPTNGMLTVQTTDKSEFTKLFIVDKLGQVRKQFTYAASEKVTINVADLPADVYLLRALINNTLVTASFIKQ